MLRYIFCFMIGGTFGAVFMALIVSGGQADQQMNHLQKDRGEKD